MHTTDMISLFFILLFFYLVMQFFAMTELVLIYTALQILGRLVDWKNI